MHSSSRILHDTLRVGELLGSGRHGVVLRATVQVCHDNDPSAESVEETVAVKVPATKRSLALEAKALARFDHEFIVSMFDKPLASGALILEYCANGTLADRVGHNELSVEEAHTILRQVGAALDRIHRAGWIHGDVSPTNIGIRGDGTTALLDFATSRHADGGPLGEGTAEFAGPRRLAEKELDLRCLAASVLAALADPTHDPAVPADVRALRQRLQKAIARADKGGSIIVADFGCELNDSRTDVAIAPRRPSLPELSDDALRGGVRRASAPQTREFGPRPNVDSMVEIEGPSDNLGRFAVLGISAVLGFLVMFVALRTESVRSALPSAHEPASVLLPVVSGTDSLSSANVVWSNGIVTLQNSAEPVSFAVGRPGDLAAVGDWNCDGQETLGVYRPETGTWFTFASWDIGAESAIEQLDAGRSGLHVEQLDGCDLAKPVG